MDMGFYHGFLHGVELNNGVKLERFDDTHWDGFSGAEEYESGAAPLYGEVEINVEDLKKCSWLSYTDFQPPEMDDNTGIVIADGTGVQVLYGTLCMTMGCCPALQQVLLQGLEMPLCLSHLNELGFTTIYTGIPY